MTYRQIPNFHSGRTDLPLIQRDALIDPGTIGLFDIAHGWGYPAMATPLSGSASLINYVRGGSAATNGPTDKTWSSASGVAFAGGGTQYISLPSAWQLGSSATKFAVGFFAKISTANITAADGNRQVVGCSSTTAKQWGLYLKYASNAYTGVAVLEMNGVSYNMTGVIPTDGLFHHYALVFVASGSNYNAYFYVDGAVVYTSSTGTYTTLAQPATTPKIGYYWNNAASTFTAGFSIPRIWMQDLSVSGSKTITALLAADRTVNAARFS